MCEFDLRSGALCPSCQRKLERGEVTRLDIDVLTALVDLNYQYLSNAEYAGSIRLKNKIFVSLRNLEATTQEIMDLSLQLSRKLRSLVRVLRDHRAFNNFLAEILAPSKILAINVVWLPDGTEETIVTVDDFSKLQFQVEEIVELARFLKGKVIRIEKTVRR